MELEDRMRMASEDGDRKTNETTSVKTKGPDEATEQTQDEAEAHGGDSSEMTATEALQEEVSRLGAEVAEQKDRYVRAVAEMDNMRRRFDREKSDLVKYSLEGILKDLLPVLDSFEKAIPEGEAAESESAASDNSYLAGMVMVKKQLLDVLKKHGLEPVNAAGEAFDPNLHQAIRRIESEDVSIETVADEYAKGYLLHGRLVRPAMVSVFIPVGK